MPAYSARIDTGNITDWETFHTVFAEALGFPGFYGRNMNAWIDCMSSPEDGMTRFDIPPGELLHLEISGTQDLAERLPEIYQELIECSIFVNWRRVESGSPPVLALVLV